MSRHFWLIAVCAGLLASAGCSNGRRGLPIGPTPTPTQEQRAQRQAALALFDAAIVHAGVTTSALTSATYDGQVFWTNGSCDGNGSLQASLDGGESPTSGTFLPTGSHTYVVSFSDCLVDGWAWAMNGVASAAYDAPEWSNVTATVSADSVHSRGYGFLSEIWDVTADGSAVWTRVGSSSSTHTTTYTPATGSRLVNNVSTRVATFGGGSYSTIRDPGNRGERRFDNLKVAIHGTEYTLNGSLESAFGERATHTGEIRIINNGTLAARIYGDVNNALTVEVLVPLVPF